MIINDESHQSKKFEFMVPQTQFVDDVWTFSLCNDRYVFFWCRKLWSFRSCCSSLAIELLQRLIPMVQSAQQILEIPQLLWSMFLLCWVVQVLRCCRGEALGAPTVAARREICDFLRPFVFGSHLFGVRLRSTGFWTFLGDDFWIFPVFSAFWFNIGYMHCVSLRSFWKIFTYFLREVDSGR